MQYGLKKKEEEQPMGMGDPGSSGRISRQKKTPEEMQAAMNAEDEEEGILETLCYRCFQM